MRSSTNPLKQTELLTCRFVILGIDNLVFPNALEFRGRLFRSGPCSQSARPLGKFLPLGRRAEPVCRFLRYPAPEYRLATSLGTRKLIDQDVTTGTRSRQSQSRRDFFARTLVAVSGQALHDVIPFNGSKPRDRTIEENFPLSGVTTL